MKSKRSNNPAKQKQVNKFPCISTLPVSHPNQNLLSKVHQAHSEVFSICWSTVIHQHPQLLWQGICVNFGDTLSQTSCFTKNNNKPLPDLCQPLHVVTQCQMSTRSSTPVGRFGPLSGGHLKRETYSSVWMRLATVANRWLSEELTNPYYRVPSCWNRNLTLLCNKKGLPTGENMEF